MQPLYFFSFRFVWYVVKHCLSCLCILCSALFVECCRYVDGVCGPTNRTSPGILKTGIRGRKLMGHWCITSNPRKTLVKSASKPHPEHRDLFKFYAWDAHTVTPIPSMSRICDLLTSETNQNAMPPAGLRSNVKWLVHVYFRQLCLFPLWFWKIRIEMMDRERETDKNGILDVDTFAAKRR